METKTIPTLTGRFTAGERNVEFFALDKRTEEGTIEIRLYNKPTYGTKESIKNHLYGAMESKFSIAASASL